MSTKKVKKYTAAQKGKLALEAIKEEKTLAQIGSENKIHPKNIRYWKKQLLDNIEVVFDKEQLVREYKKSLKESEEEIDELHRQIGELTYQFNWAKKKSERFGIRY